MTRLALFDLDHTLLSGDSDVLWCDYLMDQGLLDRAAFAPRNAEMARRYREASVGAREFCEFYVATLAGRTPAEWAPVCDRFLDAVIAPRIPPAAH
ncbi:MAG TPA: HAD family hydrolase, partial [Burkholderiaceae bacterium]